MTWQWWGHCDDIQAKDPIDCGEPLFAAAIAGAAAPISATATSMRIVAFGYWRVDGLVVGVVRSAS